MTITVYADIYFFINFLFDTIFLFVTARILNIPFKSYRILLASAAGTVYGFVCLVTVSILPFHIGAAAVICLIAFGRKRIFAVTSIFLLTSAACGGVVYGAAHLIGKNEQFFYNAKWQGVLLCIFIAAALTAGYFYVCRKNSAAGGIHAYITAGGKEYKLFLLKDNGNLLTDPLSFDPVIIVSDDAFDFDLQRDMPFSIRAIPVKTAAGSDILYGFRPEKCAVREFGKKKRREIRVIIALTKGNRFGGTYDGLMPPI